MSRRDQVNYFLVVVVLVCLALLSTWVIRQNTVLSNTLDIRHDERSNQFNTLLCVAHQVQPTQSTIDSCFTDNGLEVP